MPGILPFARLSLPGLCLAVVLTGCSKSSAPIASRPQPTPQLQASTSAPSPVIVPGQEVATVTSAKTKRAKIDPCALLSGPEIQGVQGESLKEVKASSKAEGGLNVAQCFFTLPTFTNSISLAVTQRGDGADARDPEGFWKEKFRGEEEDDREKDKGREPGQEKAKEEENEESPPLRISGVGEEAFWTGSAVGGALYVLKGNTFIRVSIGGSANQRTKIARSKALARFVLKHL